MDNLKPKRTLFDWILLVIAGGIIALAISLMAYDIGGGDEVITSTNTAIPTGMAISQTGAKPIFIDILKEEQTMNPELIEEKINKRTKAIIPVHLYGLPSKLDEINNIAGKYNIKVIEDAAQAHGSFYKNKKIGDSENLCCFSFYPSKNLGSLGDGGMITTNNKDLYEKIRKIRNYGQTTRYKSDLIGINSRLDEINSAVLRVKLKHLDQFNLRRDQISNIYDSCLTDRLKKPIRKTQDSKSSNHLYVIKTDNRNRLQIYLDDQGIQTLIHYPLPLHLQPCFIKNNNSRLPIAEENSKKILSLPLYPELNDTEVAYISERINSFFKE